MGRHEWEARGGEGEGERARLSPEERGVHDTQDVMDLAQRAGCHKAASLEALLAEIRSVVHKELPLGCSRCCRGCERSCLSDVDRHGLLH